MTRVGCYTDTVVAVVQTFLFLWDSDDVMANSAIGVFPLPVTAEFDQSHDPPRHHLEDGDRV